MLNRRIITILSENHLPMPSPISIIYTIFSCFFLANCSAARDTIALNSSLSNGETLVSAGERFELGFFSPTKSTAGIKRYVGIWYHKSNPRIFVWIANRNNPISDNVTVLAIAKDGNLILHSKASGTPYNLTDVESSSSPYRVAKLMDSGNLVLTDDQFQLSAILWESFKQPTDTFLAGMKMDQNLQLTSWVSRDDPKTGNFAFQRDHGVNQYKVMKSYVPYWRSSESDDVFNSDEIMPYEVVCLLSNFSESVQCRKASRLIFRNESRLIFRNESRLIIRNDSRLIMNFTGEIQYWREDKVKGWSLIWSKPRDSCSVLQNCGKFGCCNSIFKPECQCLPGFVPVSPEIWNSGDFSGGCTRKTALCDGKDTFLPLKMMKVRKTETQLPVLNEKECLDRCRNSCKYQAYSYEDSMRRGNPSGTAGTCWIWTEELSDLQQDFANGGRDIFVRMAASDLELGKGNCEICGINLIPYPLSTKADCGDPNYFSFFCNTSTGQISFESPSGSYHVTGIHPDSRNFSIQINGADNYQRNQEGTFRLNQSLQFYFIGKNDADMGNSSFDVSSENAYKIDIGWNPPPEPTCTSPRDCEGWPHSSCNLTDNGERRCLCKETFIWDSIALKCKEIANTEPGVGMTRPDEASNGRNMQWTLIFGVIIASVIVLSCIIIYFYTRRKKINSQEDRTISRPNMALRFYDSERHVKDIVESDQFKEDKKGIDLPFFDFESILVATDNFSESNKLGKGGFGPVYKGKFPGGQEIAVKRLSSVSVQGLEEFKNEIVLIARLQHRNLVRLLGYCIEGGEKILLYEYMTNKSLDNFIFDHTLSVLLDWEMRFNIILGIARGLLYLHQDSRLRIIHRDLKTSNILLDQDMNPKISDFGLAKIFEGKQTEGTTNRVVGTYGYMSPEYALDGFFSVKSDVFSFGVVVLEIICGKRNTGFYNSKQALSLLGFAWKLWQEGKAMDMMDEQLRASSKTNEILKCINVGLLCVQEDPIDRPTMSNVVIMLGSEATNLPSPKRPAFVVRRVSSSTASSSTKPESNNEVTLTLEGR